VRFGTDSTIPLAGLSTPALFYAGLNVCRQHKSLTRCTDLAFMICALSRAEICLAALFQLSAQLPVNFARSFRNQIIVDLGRVYFYRVHCPSHLFMHSPALMLSCSTGLLYCLQGLDDSVKKFDPSFEALRQFAQISSACTVMC